MEDCPKYKIILSHSTLDTIKTYKSALSLNTTRPGAYLKKVLEDEQIHLEQISTEKFIELLLWTKRPLIFAESGVAGNGSDWNIQELRILGDLNIAMDVKIYDNGVWSTHDEHFRQYDCPLNGTLLFTPGALLNGVAVDLSEVVQNNNINQDKYNRLIEKRLAPLLYYANESAAKDHIKAIVTIPGIGCGAFAGRFSGRMGEFLNVALQHLLEKHAQKFNNIAYVHYDPFSECTNREKTFGNVKFRVRPAFKNPGTSLLREPKEYEEQGDDFSNCKIFKIVAWDHVSFPGNDFFANSRATDDGVSAAATNSMQIVTGFEGNYVKGKYLPPMRYEDWEEVVLRNGIRLKTNSQNIVVYDIS